MSKDEKKGASQKTLADTDLMGMSPVALGDGPVEVAVVKRNGEYVVLLRARVAGKVEESVLKQTTSKLIAADRVSQALLGSGL